MSLGSCDTLIQHPAGLTHRIVSEEGRKAGGTGPGLLQIVSELKMWMTSGMIFSKPYCAPSMCISSPPSKLGINVIGALVNQLRVKLNQTSRNSKRAKI